MKLSEHEKKILEQLVAKLYSDFKAEKVILYGSAARGNMTEESDIDLLVVLPDSNWQIEKSISHLCFDAQLECGRVFATICITQQEMERSRFASTLFAHNLAEEGSVL